jgi:hypothetical protein
MGKSHFVWLSFAFLAFAVLVAANDVKYWYTYVAYWGDREHGTRPRIVR